VLRDGVGQVHLFARLGHACSSLPVGEAASFARVPQGEADNFARVPQGEAGSFAYGGVRPGTWYRVSIGVTKRYTNGP